MESYLFNGEGKPVTNGKLERLRVEREELAIVPCGGEGPYASCPKIRRAVEAGEKMPTLEGEVTTLSLEVEVQRSLLVQIATPSFELTRTLGGCERQRRVVDEERQRYEELRAVEACREERRSSGCCQWQGVRAHAAPGDGSWRILPSAGFVRDNCSLNHSAMPRRVQYLRGLGGGLISRGGSS
jgi:hypothetical protein